MNYATVPRDLKVPYSIVQNSKGHFPLGGIFREERHFLLFKDQLASTNNNLKDYCFIIEIFDKGPVKLIKPVKIAHSFLLKRWPQSWKQKNTSGFIFLFFLSCKQKQST